MSEQADGLRTCPNCNSSLEEGMVLCVQCGYDLRTGKALQEGGTDQPEPVPDSPPESVRPRGGAAAHDEKSDPKSSIGKIIKLVLLIIVLVPAAYVGYLVKRGPACVVKGEKIHLKTWKRQIADSQLWTFYLDHRRLSTDRKYPLVEFDITDKTVGTTELRGPTIKFNVISYSNEKRLFECMASGRNRPAHEISAEAVRDAAVGTIAQRIETDPAMLEKVIRETGNAEPGHAENYISICGTAGAAARPATASLERIMTAPQSPSLRKAAFDALVAIYAGELGHDAFTNVLQVAIETGDATLVEKVRKILTDAGKDALPTLKAMIANGAPATQKLTQKILDEYKAAQAAVQKAKAEAEAKRKAWEKKLRSMRR